MGPTRERSTSKLEHPAASKASWLGIRGVGAVIGAALVVISVTGCGEEEDPLAVHKSVTFSDVRDETASEFYTVRGTATGVQDGVGARITLGFDVSNANSITINPVSTIHWADGSTSKCEADFRQLPGLVETLDTWEFECEPGTFPEDTDGARLVVVDEYHD